MYTAQPRKRTRGTPTPRCRARAANHEEHQLQDTEHEGGGLFLYAALGHSPHDAVETAMDERVRHLSDILEGNLRLV